MVRVPSNMEIWGNTFPVQYELLDDSQKFMDRCLLLGTSMLLQSRQLLPAGVFKKRTVTDICRVWSPDTKHPIGARFVEKMRGVTDALKRGYLKEFMIVAGTNRDDHDDALEVFIWSIAYNNGVATTYLNSGSGQCLAYLKYDGPDSVLTQTVRLLLRIRKLCRQVLTRLPDGAFPTFRVTYNDSAPSGYQAPGFYRSEILYNLDPRARSLSVAGVSTKHHKLCLEVNSAFLDDEVVGAEKLNTSSSLDVTFVSNDGNLENTFGAVLNISSNESIELPRDRPIITIGEAIRPKQAVALESNEEDSPPQAKRGAQKRTGPVTRNGRKQEARPAAPKPVTPGRTFAIDQKTPDKQ